jgi:hypothetical protein
VNETASKKIGFNLRLYRRMLFAKKEKVNRLITSQEIGDINKSENTSDYGALDILTIKSAY